MRKDGQSRTSVGASNPFEQYRGPILVAASEIYAATNDGSDPDPAVSRVNILPQNLGDLSAEELRRAQYAEAEVNVAARGVARLAILRDQIERGGLRAGLARIETFLTGLLEKKYLEGAAAPGGLVDKVRGEAPTLE